MISTQVTVLQPDAWRRIQNSLSGYNEDKMRLQAKMKEREELHTLSKDSVKHWENTIEVGRAPSFSCTIYQSPLISSNLS